MITKLGGSGAAFTEEGSTVRKADHAAAEATSDNKVK
jgi:hypothetical protein